MKPMQQTLEVRSSAIPLFLGRPTLEPVRLLGSDGVNSLFEYELLLQTAEGLNLDASGAANWDLNDFLGRELQCIIQLDGSGRFGSGAAAQAQANLGAGERQINGLIAKAEFWGREGRQVQYRLLLRPWLHLAAMGSDCRIFQNSTVLGVLDEVLSAYPFAVEMRMVETYPLRDYQTQFNESDFGFFSRLTEKYGINYWFEHADGRHTLVLADHMEAFQAAGSAAYRHVEFHPPGWRPDAEYLHRFVPTRRLRTDGYRTRDYDYARPGLDLDQLSHEPSKDSSAAPGPAGPTLPPLTVYQWHAVRGPSHYAQPEAGDALASNDPDLDGEAFARHRLQSLRADIGRARASGNLRGMVPGRVFSVGLHPQRQANADYLVLETRFLIENAPQNSLAGPTETAASGCSRGWRVTVDLVAHPVGDMLRPALTQPKPQPVGPQTAVVVGPDGQDIWTDHLGRIKVQFPWDRQGEHNQQSSCWLRVSTLWAGSQLGSIHLPRIGQEVLVDFMNGDMDQPVCTGRVFNGQNTPPWSLPGQAALSGIRSRELGGEGAGDKALGRSNHLVLDDTAGKIQVQLKSDHQHSQLSLGHIHRIEDHQGRKDARGQGFELRSDGHGALRAGAGLLLSTEARPRAARHVKSLDETAQRLTASRDLLRALADSARQAGAQQPGDQDEVEGRIAMQNTEIGGGRSSASFPELSRPHLVVASAAGIGCTSTGSTHIASGEHIALSSDGHSSLSAGKSLLASARDAIRLFAFGAGMRLIAAGGDIEIKALRNSIALLARMDIRLQGDSIQIHATREVLINGGGSFVRINAAGVTVGTEGEWKVHSGVAHSNAEDSLPVRDTDFPPPSLHDGAENASRTEMSV